MRQGQHDSLPMLDTRIRRESIIMIVKNRTYKSVAKTYRCIFKLERVIRKIFKRKQPGDDN